MNIALTHEHKLRIALLGYRSHPHVGGQGIYLHYLSKALAEIGHEVVVFSGPPYPRLAEGVQLVRVPSLDLYAKAKPLRSLTWKNLFSYTDMYEWFSKLSGGFAEPYTFGRRLLKYHGEKLKNFDIIHDNQSLCYSLLNLQKAGCRVTATIHHPVHKDRDLAIASVTESGHRLLIRRWYRFIGMQEKVALQLPCIVTVSQRSREDIVNNFKLDTSSIAVIPNGIDTRLFKPQAHIAKQAQRIITTASSDQTLKGLHILLQAFTHIQHTRPGCELFVVGKLKNDSLAHKVFTSLNDETKSKIHFRSGLSTEQLIELYASATVAVCPSLYEGFGMPALEAMACGLPLVSSDGGALPEVVGEAGLLVPAGNVEKLADTCTMLLADTAMQATLSKKALKRVQAHFCWQNIAQRYLAFYYSMLPEHVNA